MSDINLLPEELRAAERQEQTGGRATQPPPRYTRAQTPPPRPSSSQLEERLQALSEGPASGWWQRITDWFMKPPAPPAPPPSVVPPPARAPAKARASETLPPQTTKQAAPPAPPATSRTNVQPEVLAPSADEPDVPLGVVLDVNLLPAEDRPVHVDEGYTARLGLVLLVSCLLVGIGYGILKTITVQRERKVVVLHQEATTLAQDIDRFRPALKVLQATSAKVFAIEELLKARPDWDQLFDRLQDLTLTTVSYSSASLTSEGDLILAVEATSVSDLARQLRVFESAPGTFSTVSLGSIAVGTASDQAAPLVQSTFQLKLAPSWAQAPQSAAGQ